MKVLVTDGKYKHSLGIVRALGKSGIRPIVISLKKGSLSSKSKYCQKEYVTVDYQSEEFESQFIDILKNEKIDLVMPVGVDAFRKLIDLKDKIEIYSKFVSVNVEKMNLCLSKKLTYQFAENIGIPVPKTKYPTSLLDVEIIGEEISYPCVIKWLYEVGGNIVEYAYNKQELISKYGEVCERYGFNEHTGFPLIQEYIRGKGCGFFAVYNNGQCGSTFQHLRIREYPVTGGASAAAESYRNNKVQEYGKKLLDSLEWHGVAMVEFKLTDEGEPVLMEVNPKFWGSTDLCIEAGVNMPELLTTIAKGEDVVYSEKYKFPFRYHWPLQGEYKVLLSDKSKLFEILVDIFNPKVKSNIWFFSDVVPTLYMIAQFINSILGRIFKNG